MARKKPESGTVLLVAGIVGFLISVFYVWRFSPAWATAFGIVFLIMVVASLRTMKTEDV